MGICSLALLTMVVAQTASVRIVVSANGVRVPDASVVVNGATHRADPDGVVSLDLPAGTVEIVVVKEGLAPASVSVELRPGEARTITIALVQREAARAAGIEVSDLIGPSRSAKPLQARQLAIYLSRELTPSSLPEIGREFGGRDHTTVLSSVRRVDQRLVSNPELALQLDQLRQAIHSAAAAAD